MLKRLNYNYRSETNELLAEEILHLAPLYVNCLFVSFHYISKLFVYIINLTCFPFLEFDLTAVGGFYYIISNEL